MDLAEDGWSVREPKSVLGLWFAELLLCDGLCLELVLSIHGNGQREESQVTMLLLSPRSPLPSPSELAMASELKVTLSSVPAYNIVNTIGCRTSVMEGGFAGRLIHYRGLTVLVELLVTKVDFTFFH